MILVRGAARRDRPRGGGPHLFGLAKASFTADAVTTARCSATRRDLSSSQGRADQALYVLRLSRRRIVVEQLSNAGWRRGWVTGSSTTWRGTSRAAALRIVVEQDNMPARDFYQRAGFDPVDTEIFERTLPTS